MTATKTRECKVQVSGYHDGQIVVPQIDGCEAAGATYRLRWHWVDRSVPEGKEGRHYGHSEASGDFHSVIREAGLAGLHLNDING